VRTHKVVFDRLLDLRHVASDTLAARASLRVVRMFAHCSVESSSVLFGVAKEAKQISRHLQIRLIGVAVDLMAVKTTKSTMVHCALHKIVSLHPVLVRSQFSVLIEISRSRLGLFKLPMISQPFSW
jgi:hypothetical protein